MRESLIRMIAVTWEICGGREVSDAALDTLVDALENYDPRAVGKALLRCQTECKGLISLADIVARIDDGRPGLEEAWAMIPSDEAHSVVWTDEMAEAYDVVKDMLGEPIAARMAFKEAYQRICSEARLEKRPIHWFLSPGTDESLKQRTMVDAVEKNRLTPGYAMELAPHLMEEPMRARGLLPGEDVPQLPPAQEHKRLPEPGVCPESGIEWVSPDEIREFADNLARRVALKEQKEREVRRAQGDKGGVMKRGLVSKDFDLCDHDRAIYCHVCAEENTTLKALIIRTVKSGLLCDPGCCGDDCVCDELREVAKGE